MWSNIEQTIIQCFQNIYSYRNIYITCSQMYDLLIKIDWIIMCLLLYSDLFSGSVIFFFKKHKNPSFVQKRLNWTNRCCKMFHILSCYYITIHCSNFKIWQWCILAGQSISVFSWVDRKHLANEDAPRRCKWCEDYRSGMELYRQCLSP